MTKETALLWISTDTRELLANAMTQDVIYQRQIDNIDEHIHELELERNKIFNEKKKEVMDYIRKKIEEAKEVLKEP